MGDLNNRLTKLESRMLNSCPTCRDWTVGVLRVTFGDESAEPTRSSNCPDCGRGAPLQVTLVRVTEQPDGPA